MNINKIIRIILLIIVFISFGLFGYYYYKSLNNQKNNDSLSELTQAETDGVIIKQESEKYVVTKEDQILNKYKKLYLKNKNLIGWLKIDDTNIDYPVMKSINNNGEFYLSHDYDGNEDRNGTIFMDDECDPYTPSDNLIIYGHNMKSGQMFGSLSNYKNQEFYENHRTVKFDTIYSEGEYEVEFVFQSKVYSEADITFKYYQFIEPNSKEEFDSGIREMRKLSIYENNTEINYGDQLLSLSTCDYDESNGRLVIVCKRVK